MFNPIIYYFSKANLKNPTVYQYPSTDGSVKTIVVFTTEPNKNYEDIIPFFAELFEFVVSSLVNKK